MARPVSVAGDADDVEGRGSDTVAADAVDVTTSSPAQCTQNITQLNY